MDSLLRISAVVVASAVLSGCVARGWAPERTDDRNITVELEVSKKGGAPALAVKSNSAPCDASNFEDHCIYVPGGNGSKGVRITFELDHGCYELFNYGFQFANGPNSFGQPVDPRVIRDFVAANRKGHPKARPQGRPNPQGLMPVEDGRNGLVIGIWDYFDAAADAPYETYYQVFATPGGAACTPDSGNLKLDPRIRNGGERILLPVPVSQRAPDG